MRRTPNGTSRLGCLRRAHGRLDDLQEQKLGLKRGPNRGATGRVLPEHAMQQVEDGDGVCVLDVKERSQVGGEPAGITWHSRWTAVQIVTDATEVKIDSGKAISKLSQRALTRTGGQ
jgi:hypothetical protein